MPIIDIHTHCAPRPADDRFDVAAALRGRPIGRNVVADYRGLPAVGYYERTDFELQQEVLGRAGVTGRLISNSFGAETWSEISPARELDIVRFVNDQIATLVARAPGNWGLGTINPLDRAHIAEGERCLDALGFKGLLINTSWHGRFIDGEDAFAFWEWAEDDRCRCSSIRRACRSATTGRWTSTSSTSWSAARSTPRWRSPA